MWFVLALCSAALFAVQSAVAKRLGARYHPDVIVWANFLFSIPIYATFCFFYGLPEVEPAFWLWLGISTTTNLVAIPLFFRALAMSDLSIVMPLIGLTPLFALFTEPFMLGDWPGDLAVLGGLLLVLGAYLLHAGALHLGLLAPLRALVHDRGARLALITALVWSISAVSDRGAVMASSPVFFLTAFVTLYPLIFLPWLLYRHRPELKALWLCPWPLGVVALLGSAMAFCQMTALDLALATEVVSVKRLSVLFGVLIGGLFFREKGLSVRLLASGIMVIGAVVLAFD